MDNAMPVHFVARYTVATACATVVYTVTTPYPTLVTCPACLARLQANQ